jgi:toxin FitB
MIPHNGQGSTFGSRPREISAWADRVLPIDEPIAEAWAKLGIPNPLPLIDGLLAATAKVHDLTLVTRNVAQIAATGASVFDPFSAVRPA